MAARQNATPADTSGKYVLNKSLSTPHDDVLAAQGVSWLQRTAISIATVNSLIKKGVDLGHSRTQAYSYHRPSIRDHHFPTYGHRRNKGLKSCA